MQQPKAAAAGVVRPGSFYKRTLPCPPAIAFSSAEGKHLFAEALADGCAQGFFKLIEQFRTQDEPAFCGLASLAMVLNALAVDPRRPWKGPWRWFHEQMLDCCRPLSEVIQTGVILDQVACLARCNGAKADLHRYGAFSEDSFRATVLETCTSEQQHVVVSYSRKQFLQTGDGHFSPIGAYHASKDLALILDTARFKYPPHWVPLKELYAAMAHVDSATSKPRGFIVISPKPCMDSVMFTLNRSSWAWNQVNAFVTHTLPQLLSALPSQTAPTKSDQPQAPSSHSPGITQLEQQQDQPSHSAAAAAAATEIIKTILDQMPKEAVLQLLTVRPVVSNCCSSSASACISPAATAHFLQELHSTDAFASVHKWCGKATDAQQSTEASASVQRRCSKTTDAQEDCAGNGSFTEQLPHEQRQERSEPFVTAPAEPNSVMATDCAAEDAVSTPFVTTQTAQQPAARETSHSSVSAAQDETHGDDADYRQQSLAGIAESSPKATAPADRTCRCQQKPIAADVSNKSEGDGSANPCCSAKSVDKAATGAHFYSAEAISMFLLLVPKAVWDGICNTQVRERCLSLGDVPSGSILASEVKYVANQWAELPELQHIESCET